LETAPNYLALPNVVCVGGSWMLRPEAIAAHDWEAVTAASKQAARLHSDSIRGSPLRCCV
jgi:2-dehydro-3-deoxyphosphogluconate aldolase/(4S)-4-hydroxy-2-oxoglutarate aldolase